VSTGLCEKFENMFTLSTQYTNVMDRHLDRRTDRHHTTAYAALKHNIARQKRTPSSTLIVGGSLFRRMIPCHVLPLCMVPRTIILHWNSPSSPRVHPWTSSKTVYRDLLSSCVPARRRDIPAAIGSLPIIKQTQKLVSFAALARCTVNH